MSRDFVAPNGRSRAHIANVLNYATSGLTNKKRLGTPVLGHKFCAEFKPASPVLRMYRTMHSQFHSAKTHTKKLQKQQQRLKWKKTKVTNSLTIGTQR